MPKVEKVEKVKKIKEKMSGSSVIILTDYRGMTVNEITNLRNKLRQKNTEYKVIKNRLANLAIEKENHAKIKELLEGPTAIAFGFGDPILPAKIIFEFIKEHDKPIVKGGIVEEKFQDAEGIKTLSKLPSREMLLSMVVSGIQSPISSFVNVLHGTLRKFVYVLEAIRKSKEQK